MLSLNYSAGFRGRTFSRDVTALLQTGLLSLLSPFSFFFWFRQEREKEFNMKTTHFFLQLPIRKDEGKPAQNVTVEATIVEQM